MPNAGAPILATDVALPDPQMVNVTGLGATPTATTLVDIPSISVTQANPRSDTGMLVLVEFGAQLIAQGAATRMTLTASGANSWVGNTTGPGGTAGPGSYSENMLELQTQTTASGMTLNTSFTMVIPASGTTTIKAQSWKSAAGTSNLINNPRLRITPLRYQ